MKKWTYPKLPQGNGSLCSCPGVSAIVDRDGRPHATHSWPNSSTVAASVSVGIEKRTGEGRRIALECHPRPCQPALYRARPCGRYTERPLDMAVEVRILDASALSDPIASFCVHEGALHANTALVSPDVVAKHGVQPINQRS